MSEYMGLPLILKFYYSIGKKIKTMKKLRLLGKSLKELRKKMPKKT